MRYESRFLAGELLANFIVDNEKPLSEEIFQDVQHFFCFAIPNGGVPVAEGFCTKLNINYDLLIVRKIKIPYNPEAGFGAIAPDGSVFINESLLYRLNLNQKEIENSIELTKNEINERLIYYGKTTNLDDILKRNIQNNTIFMIDDGLASGYTMLAAIKMVKKYKPKQIFISIPTAPLHTVKNLQKETDKIFCPNIRDTNWFAVADAYKHWYDVSELEVMDIITHSKSYYR